MDTGVVGAWWGCSSPIRANGTAAAAITWPGPGPRNASCGAQGRSVPVPVVLSVGAGDARRAVNGEAVGGGEEGDVDVGELLDEPQSKTAASGTAGGADEAGERVGRSGAVVVHTDHDPVQARPDRHVMGRRPCRCALTTASETANSNSWKAAPSMRPCAASATRCRVCLGRG